MLKQLNEVPRLNQQTDDALISALKETSGLFYAAQLFHWNVTGPVFLQLHSFFKDQYQEALNGMDEIAEHLQSEGQTISSDMILEVRTDGFGVKGPDEMLENLLERHLAARTALKQVLELSEDNPELEDLVSGRLAHHKESIWMLRAMLK